VADDASPRRSEGSDGSATDTGESREAPAPDGPDDDLPVSRRWLIRLLVGLGIGIPVAIEGWTFTSLLRKRLFGGDEDDDDGAPPTTTTLRTVGIGGELLPETAPADRLTTATIDAGEEQWRLLLTVEVQNDTETEYELRLGAVTTTDGETVPGEATTGTVAPGETGFATGEWALPTGGSPQYLAVTALVGDQRVEKRVGLARIPVER
jgi:hypothetical protein